MNEAWFSAQIAPYFSLLSLLSLLAILQAFAKRGRYRAVVMAAYYGCTLFGLALLGFAGLGHLQGQPGYVVQTLLWSGAVTFPIMVVTTLLMRNAYHRSELRRSTAADL